MKNMYCYLIMAAIAMGAEPTPAEREMLNQFLRGSNKIADWYKSVGSLYTCITFADAATILEVMIMNLFYCLFLLLSLSAGNKITDEERIMLNNYLRPQACANA